MVGAVTPCDVGRGTLTNELTGRAADVTIKAREPLLDRTAWDFTKGLKRLYWLELQPNIGSPSPVRVSEPPSLRVRSGLGVNGTALLEDHGRVVTVRWGLNNERTALLAAVDAACHCLASG
ncbi:hypothetical protein AOLI_G00293390 [Acnodon oligacanthus]